MRKKNTVVGLNLWSVDIEYQAGLIPFDREPMIKFKTLWITTRNNSIKQAISKAETFLKKEYETYTHARINSVMNSGTIDA
jgi:hypothetical protein